MLSIIKLGLFDWYLGQSVHKLSEIASSRTDYRKRRVVFTSAVFILMLVEIWSLEVINAGLGNNFIMEKLSFEYCILKLEKESGNLNFKKFLFYYFFLYSPPPTRGHQTCLQAWWVSTGRPRINNFSFFFFLRTLKIMLKKYHYRKSW